jgi:hypothetical protein
VAVAGRDRVKYTGSPVSPVATLDLAARAGDLFTSCNQNVVDIQPFAGRELI